MSVSVSSSVECPQEWAGLYHVAYRVETWSGAVANGSNHISIAGDPVATISALFQEEMDRQEGHPAEDMLFKLVDCLSTRDEQAI